MALKDYTLGPDGKTVYFQGKPLPPELQERARALLLEGTGNARATQPKEPGFNATIPNTPLAPGGSYPGRTAAPAPPTGGTADPGFGSGGKYPGFGPGAGAPAPAAAAVPGGDEQYQPKPGTPAWDQYRVNDMLRANGYNDWVMTSATPVESQKFDQYGEPVEGAIPAYIINIRNPQTNEIKRITMNRVWRDASGALGTTDPGGAASSGYGYQLGGIEDQQRSDPSKVGHSDLRNINGHIWGTNNTTGAFEIVPNSPDIPVEVKSWSDIRQVDDGQGNQIWVGSDPKDGQMKQVPNMPVIPKAAVGYGNPYQVPNKDGSSSWWGLDPVTKKPVRIPDMPDTPAKPAGPGSISQNNVTYVQKADGTYAPAPGVPDPNPPKGTPQIKLGNDGFLYRQISNGDGTFEPDATFEPVPLSDAAKQVRAQAGAVHKAGEPGTKIIGGKEFPIVYRGGSDDNYDVVPASQGGKASPYPGAVDPTSIATSNDQEFIAQRMPDGSIQTIKNPNWSPTDPALRIRQLSAQANDKFKELQARLSPSYTAEQAQKDYDQWWSTNVAPAQQQIQIDQQKQQVDLQNKIVDQSRSNYATAVSAGNGVVGAFTAGREAGYGPTNFEQSLQAIGQGKTSGPEFDNSVSYQGTNPVDLYQNSVMDALKHISPTAAAATGAPMPDYSQVTPAVGLDKSWYAFGGGQPPAPPAVNPPVAPSAPVAPATPGAPAPGSAYDWNALFERLGNADARRATVAAMGQTPYLYGG